MISAAGGGSELSHIQCSCFDTIRPVVRAHDIGPCGHWIADSSFKALFAVENEQADARLIPTSVPYAGNQHRPPLQTMFRMAVWSGNFPVSLGDAYSKMTLRK